MPYVTGETLALSTLVDRLRILPPEPGDADIFDADILIGHAAMRRGLIPQG
jgi:hypothetical protein